MYRTLFMKELREVLGIAITSLVVYLLVVTSGWATGLAPWSNAPKRIPFVDVSFISLFACVAAALALALGLKQTVSESIGDSYLFLLHRPMSRSHLIGMKLFGFWLALLATYALSVTLAWFCCCRRQNRYAARGLWGWGVFVVLFGVPGFFGYLFHRRWPVLEACPRCDGLVPRDRSACSVCGEMFPEPEPTGCEICA